MAENSKLKIPVEFGGVSIGDQVARIGVTFDRSALELQDANDTFVGKRLDVRIVVLRDGEDANQQTLVDGARHEIVGSADVKRLSLSPKKFSCGLSLNIESIAKEQLFAFAKKSGVMFVRGVAELPDAPAGDDTDTEE